MKNDFTEYENACKQIRQENAILLDGFVLLMHNQRLSPKTINSHRNNIEFFLNEFLLCEDAKQPSDGIAEIEEYFGDWFIRKAMWYTPGTIKSNATSLYKFYSYLAAIDKIPITALVELKEAIVLSMPEWQARCERYNEDDIDDWRGEEYAPYG